MHEKVKTYQDLVVWQKSMLLVQEIYRLTDAFPKKEQYRLADQLCRCCVSIPSNIAEGSARRSTKDYIRFINIAYGSLMECETQLRISHSLGYLDEVTLSRLLAQTVEIAKMLNALHTSLKNKLVVHTGFSEDEPAEYQIQNTEY